MKFKRTQKKEAIIDMASLVDIVFLLLLFFVVTTTFKESPGLEIDLPETSNITGVKIKDIIIQIAPLDDDAVIYLGEEQVALDDLEAKLRSLLEARKPDKRALVIQADKNVRFEVVFAVVDIARNSGATSFTFPAIMKQEGDEQE